MSKMQIPKEELRDVLIVDGESLTIENLIAVAGREMRRVRLSNKATSSMKKSEEMIEQIIKEKKPVYAVSTGVGGLSNTVIDSATSEEFQKRILLSCAVGVGPALSKEIVRAAILCRLNTFASGHSGVRLQIAEFLCDLLNNHIYPYVPEQGSLGCSGDIAPLAHIGLLALGEGEIISEDGSRRPARETLAGLGLEPIRLKAKEGISLVNGCSLSAGLAAICYYQGVNLLKAAELISAMSVEALRGSKNGFHPSLIGAKPHRGQIKIALDIRRMISGSSLLRDSPNDPYTIKAIPQVLGTACDALDFARGIATTEINSSSDNPLLFPDDQDQQIISGANFHAQEVAFVMDSLAIALAPVGDLAERRVERILNPTLSNKLPPFLVKNPGINSGFLDAQFTISALSAENKTLCTPASINPSSVSAAAEDHASQAPIAGRKLLKLISNMEFMLGIEMICAAQALDFRLIETPTEKMGRGVQTAHDLCRSEVSFLTDDDRVLYPDFNKIQQMIHSGKLVRQVENSVGKFLE